MLHRLSRNRPAVWMGAFSLSLCCLFGGLLCGCGGSSGSNAPPLTGAVGQLLTGAGSTNYSKLTTATTRLGVGFTSPKTGTLTGITLQWKTSEGYGAGNDGIFTFTLRENGPDNYATGPVIATAADIVPATAMDGREDGILHFPITATLTAGRIYHLVIQNSADQPELNWSSPNMLMTRLIPWDGAGNRVAQYENGVWTPWTSVDNLFNTTGTNEVNGSYCPLLLSWTDGANTGDPYYTTSPRYITGDQTVGQRLQWIYPTSAVRRIGFYVWKAGAPGELRYTLEDADTNTVLAGGHLAQPEDIGPVGSWVYATLPAPVTLVKERTYYLYMTSPDSPDTDNCYFTYLLYSDSTFPVWMDNTWGGTESCTIYIENPPTWEAEENSDTTFYVEL
ncbi:MAG: hypothetical protein ACYC7E_21030 [Armatimonadota bacterium]